MKRALVAFFLIACGGSVSPDPASKSAIVDSGAPRAPQGTDGGAAAQTAPPVTAPPVDQCPATAPPKSTDTCSPSSEGLMCDYGECQPQCRCKGGEWSCSSDDCVPPMPPCPAALVSSGDACTQILQKCQYTAFGDKQECICAIDEKWVCRPIN